MTTGQKELPVGWKSVKLGELLTDVQSGFASGKRDSEGVIQLRMNNVNTTGGFDWSKTLRVPSDAANLSKYRLDEGDVLFNNTNSPDLVGKAAVFKRHEELIVYSNHCCQSAKVGRIGTRENYCYGEPALSSLAAEL